MTMVILIIYCLLIVGASILGGLVPTWLTLTHRRMQVALSFVAGVMLGVAFLHLLPHAWLEWREAKGPEASLQPVILWLLGGFLALFLLERFLAFHHHEADESEHDEHQHANRDVSSSASANAGLTWGGAFLGLAVHTLLNGVALAASVVAATHSNDATIGPVGLATFLVIFLHKPFDAMTIGTLMAAGGRPLRMRHGINALFALMVPAGAALFALGLQLTGPATHTFIAASLALSAGMFLCIALSDLLPELHFHAHDRLKLTAALVVGLVIAYVIMLAEGEIHHHDGHEGIAPANERHID